MAAYHLHRIVAKSSCPGIALLFVRSLDSLNATCRHVEVLSACHTCTQKQHLSEFDCVCFVAGLHHFGGELGFASNVLA